MKKIMLCIMGVVSLLVVGCAQNKEITAESDFALQESSMESVAESVEQSVDISEMEVSTKAMEVVYTGEVPISDVYSLQGHIYFTCEVEGAQAGIYEMELEGSDAQAVISDLQEGWIPKVLTVGTDGSIYTILKNAKAEKTESKMLLWKVAEDGTILWEKDITELVPDDASPWAIAIDAEDYIFARIGIMRETLFLVFEANGNYCGQIANEEGFLHIDALGRGKDGLVYAVLERQDETNVLAKCDAKSCTMELYELGTEVSGFGLFSLVGSGRDSDLVLYGPSYGICKYNLGENASVYMQPQAFPCSVDGRKCCILEDGRLCMVATNGNAVENTILYYIPFVEQ